MAEETKAAPAEGRFVTLMLGFILGYQGVKLAIHAAYWVAILGLAGALWYLHH